MLIPLQPRQPVPDDDRQRMRDAVLQVLHDLIEERVPAALRSPLFGKARELVEQSGWSLDELQLALAPGRHRDLLFELLEI